MVSIGNQECRLGPKLMLIIFKINDVLITVMQTVLPFLYWSVASGVAWKSQLGRNCFSMKGHYSLDLTPSQKAESHHSF